MLLLVASPAAAERQPAILQSYGLDWIERVKDEAWPGAKEKRPVICLLDTGVAITPDTPADNPMGPIVARLSVEDPIDRPPPSGDQSLGLPQGTSWAHLHGTRMAAIMAAPRNGEGTVGVFPQARIVSVRVSTGGDVYISPADLERGVRQCKKWIIAQGARLASVVMPESGYLQRKEDLGYWRFSAAVTQELDGLLVAAIGNDKEAASVAPLAVPEVISVGAADEAGEFCSFAPTGGSQILGPGCAASGWAPGSSSATVVVGALLGVLVTREPSLDAAGLRARLAELLAGEPSRVSGAALIPSFGNLIQSDPPTKPESGLAVSKEAEHPDDKAIPSLRLWRPTARLRWSSGRLTVERRAYRSRGVLKVAVAGRTLTVTSVRARLKIASKPRRATVWAESADGTTWRSLTSRVRVR